MQALRSAAPRSSGQAGLSPESSSLRGCVNVSCDRLAATGHDGARGVYSRTVISFHLFACLLHQVLSLWLLDVRNTLISCQNQANFRMNSHTPISPARHGHSDVHCESRLKAHSSKILDPTTGPKTTVQILQPNSRLVPWPCTPRVVPWAPAFLLPANKCWLHSIDHTQSLG